MTIETILRRLVVIGTDDQNGIRTSCGGMFGQTYRLGGAVGTSTGNHRYTARRLFNTYFDDPIMFAMCLRLAAGGGETGVRVTAAIETHDNSRPSSPRSKRRRRTRHSPDLRVPHSPMSSELSGMVLRCEKTGKLFYSTKEAELHGEETGLSDFAQVSLEEKVWVCVETGKVCFNETQMDIHKRRVPEAVTWEEKTVAHLKEKEEEKKKAASADGATDMETEEDILLRAAGKAPKGK